MFLHDSTTKPKRDVNKTIEWERMCLFMEGGECKCVWISKYYQFERVNKNENQIKFEQHRNRTKKKKKKTMVKADNNDDQKEIDLLKCAFEL